MGLTIQVYQEVECRDLRQKVVTKQRTENLTYSISKNPSKHQGVGDFISEG